MAVWLRIRLLSDILKLNIRRLPSVVRGVHKSDRQYLNSNSTVCRIPISTSLPLTIPGKNRDFRYEPCWCPGWDSNPHATRTQEPKSCLSTSSNTWAKSSHAGARGRNRTGTEFPPRDFKSLVSTSFTTRADGSMTRVAAYLREDGISRFSGGAFLRTEKYGIIRCSCPLSGLARLRAGTPPWTRG